MGIIQQAVITLAVSMDACSTAQFVLFLTPSTMFRAA
jgi:hypothetical protein